jgi:hypothetical protein
MSGVTSVCTWNKEIFIEQVPEITWVETQRMKDGLVEAEEWDLQDPTSTTFRA